MENNQSFQPWGVYFYPISREPINVVKIVDICSSGCYVREKKREPKFWLPGSCLWICQSISEAIQLYIDANGTSSYSSLIEDLIYNFDDIDKEISHKKD